MLRQEALRIANELSLEGFHASPGYLANFMRRAGVEMWCAFVWLPFIEFFCGTIHGEEEINPLHAAFEVVGHVREFRSVVEENNFMAGEIATGDETGIRPLANMIRTLQVTRGREKKRSKARIPYTVRRLALQRARIAKHGKLSVSILFAALLDGRKLPPVIMIPRIRQHNQLTAVFLSMAAHG